MTGTQKQEGKDMNTKKRLILDVAGKEDTPKRLSFFLVKESGGDVAVRATDEDGRMLNIVRLAARDDGTCFLVRFDMLPETHFATNKDGKIAVYGVSE